MITFRKVREDDLELNSKIEGLNIKVFPSTETTSDLHFLENYWLKLEKQCFRNQRLRFESRSKKCEEKRGKTCSINIMFIFCEQRAFSEQKVWRYEKCSLNLQRSK